MVKGAGECVSPVSIRVSQNTEGMLEILTSSLATLIYGYLGSAWANAPVEEPSTNSILSLSMASKAEPRES